jgi:glycosyltransferase involved in cell wall biosynthesis
MKIVGTGYINTPEFTDPDAWLDRISFYTGILEQLSKQHTVESIEQINYSGKVERNKVVYHFLNFKKRNRYFPWKLNWYIRKLHPDVMIVNGLIFPLQLIQLRWMLGKKVRIIVAHHAEKPGLGKLRFLQRIADRYINVYLFVSYEMGDEWIKQGIIAGREKIVEAMEASSSFKVMNRQEAINATKVSGHPVFLWVGRLNANKDPLTVLNAFLQFVAHQPTAVLYMIYQEDDLLAEVKELIQDNGSIKLVGKVPHNQLEAWYNSADFIISGSHYEGSGIAVCEAMSCGCIPVLTNIQSFRKMSGQGKCGLLYEPGNADELVKALLKTQEINKEKEREKVLQQFNDELSFTSIATKIEQLIQTSDKT